MASSRNHEGIFNYQGMLGDSTSGESKAKAVTAVLLNWKRPGNLNTIVGYLQKRNWIDEIIVWNNSTEKLAIDSRPGLVRIVDSEENLKDYAKYKACSLAKNDVCLYQDDDWYAGEYIDALHRSYQLNPRVLHIASNAQIVATNLLHEYRNSERGIHADIGWIGCGAMFPRHMADDYVKLLNENFDADERPISDCGFSILQNQPTVQLQVALRPLDQSNAFSRKPEFRTQLDKVLVRVRSILPERACDERVLPQCVARGAQGDGILFTSFPPVKMGFDDTRYDPDDLAAYVGREFTRAQQLEYDQFVENPYTQALGLNPEKSWRTRVCPGDTWGILYANETRIRLKIDVLMDSGADNRWVVASERGEQLQDFSAAESLTFNVNTSIFFVYRGLIETEVSIKIQR